MPKSLDQVVRQARPFPARVAHIQDEYRLVINRGARDGVEIDQHFIVYGHGDQIKDPETGEILERLEIVRGRGRVIHLQETVATIYSMATRQETVPNYGLLLGGQGGGTRTVTLPFKEPQVGDFVRRP